VNAEDSPCCRRRLNVRVTHGLLIDKVIRSSGGELFDAVVEARWVHGVHFHIGRRKAQHTVGGRVRTLPRALQNVRQFRADTGRFRTDDGHTTYPTPYVTCMHARYSLTVCYVLE
jgi:hypothetical protein